MAVHPSPSAQSAATVVAATRSPVALSNSTANPSWQERLSRRAAQLTASPMNLSTVPLHAQKSTVTSKVPRRMPWAAAVPGEQAQAPGLALVSDRGPSMPPAAPRSGP
jgi:hypothetical protein